MIVASIDEAGRGSLFGRVYSAAVIWNPNITHKYLKDSKTLTERQRNLMRDFILENAIDYSISYATTDEINELNILQATILSMHRSLDNLNLLLDHIEVDGNYFKPWNNTPFTCKVKGDLLCPGISAASILAKTSRDEYRSNK